MAGNNRVQQLITEKTADAAAATSGIGFAITLADIDTIVSICAGLAAVIAAGAAAYYHIKKGREIGRFRKPPPNPPSPEA